MSEAVTCARLILGNQKVLFVTGSWFDDHFSLAAFDGQNSWTLQASEEQVAGRAEGWDKTVSAYMDICRKHLGKFSSGSNYQFDEEGQSSKLSFETKDNHGNLLRGIWRLKKDPNPSQVPLNILNCLVDRNEILEESASKSKRDFDRMKDAAEKSLQQTERYKNAKKEFEEEIYKKFVAVLNSKKAKLRELRHEVARSTPIKPKRAVTKDEDEDLEGGSTESEDEGSGRDMEGPAAGGESPLFTTQDFHSNPSHLEPSLEDAAHTTHANQGQAPGIHETETVHQSQQATAQQATASVEAKHMADALLSSTSDYTSAPRRRRRL